MPPTAWKSSSSVLERGRGRGDADGRQHHHGRMAEREEQAGRQRALALLHELAGDVVDGRDVVGVDRMAQPEAVGEEAGAEQHRVVVERDQRPGPGRDVGRDQQRIDGDDLAAQVGGAIVEATAGSDMDPRSTRSGRSHVQAETSYCRKTILKKSRTKDAALGKSRSRARIARSGRAVHASGAYAARRRRLPAVPVRMLVRGAVGVGVRLDQRRRSAPARCGRGGRRARRSRARRNAAPGRPCRAGSSPPCSSRGRDARASRRATIRDGRGRCRRAAWKAAARCGRRRRPRAATQSRCLSMVSAAWRMPARARSRIASERF